MLYGDYVEAPDWDAAQAICDERRAHCKERVVGKLVGAIEVDDITMIQLGAILN
jgi:hypothetical protein